MSEGEVLGSIEIQVGSILAEGLRNRFEGDGTYCDMNRCATVLWSRDDDKTFRHELIAMLRRLLDQSL